MTLIAVLFPEIDPPKNMVTKMSQKPCFRGHLDRKDGKIGWNTGAIWMAEPLQYLLITVKVVALEKISFSNIQNPKTVS